MTVTSESTLKELVDETTVIKNDLISCRDELKTNLSNKGVDVTGLNKMGELIPKIGKLEILDLVLKPMLLSYDHNHGLLESKDINTFATLKKTELGFGVYYNLFGDFNGGKPETYICQRDSSSIYWLYSFNAENFSVTHLLRINDSTLINAGGVYDGNKLRVFSLQNNDICEIDPKTFTIIKRYEGKNANFNKIEGGFDFNTDAPRIFTTKRGHSSQDWSYIYELDVDTLSIIRSQCIEKSMAGVGCIYDPSKKKIRLYCTCDVRNANYDKIIELDINNFSIINEANTTRYETDCLCGCSTASIMFRGHTYKCV